MAVPYTFATASGSIPLSQLDTNFATSIVLGNTAVVLGNTYTTLNSLTLGNVTISSGNATITNISVTTANATTANVVTLSVTGNQTVGGNVAITGNVSMNVATITTSNVTTENVSSLIVSGNQTFVGTGNRITGDFSNATIANRVAFQTSTANGVTVIGLLTNGTGTISALQVNNVSDITTALSFGNFQASSTEVSIQSGIRNAGTYLPMTFYTSGGEKMRLDTSGNLGLGVTPSAWQVSSLRKSMEFASPGNAIWGYTGEMRMMMNVYYNGTNFVYGTTGVNASIYEQGAGSHVWFTAPSGTAGNAITFTQAMTLDASGNLLVGQTATGIANATSYAFQLDGQGIRNNHGNGTPSGYAYMQFGYNGGSIGSITQNGTTGVLYNITSDYRLKENVAKITNGLDTISKLNPVTFDWTTDKTSDSGFIAHEFQSVLPRSVTGTKDAVDADGKPVYQGMDNSGAVPYLVAGMQELIAEIASLKSQLKAAGVAGF